MKYFKRFIVIILAICAVMVCASCKKCSKNKNRLIPTLSDPTGTYLKIGNYTITKKDVYYQLLNSYGTEVLLNMVDDALLPALSDEEGFQEYLDEIIYGDEEKTWKQFGKSAATEIDGTHHLHKIAQRIDAGNPLRPFGHTVDGMVCRVLLLKKAQS